MDIFIAFIAFSLLLVITVGIHEYGHYKAARILNISVKEFSIGVGRSICIYRKGITDFKIGILPIGGYVQFNQKESGIKPLDSDIYYEDASNWKKIVVSLSGPLMNFIIAVVFLTFLNFNSENITKSAQVTHISESINYNNREKLEVGDIITEVNSQKIKNEQDFYRALLKSNFNETIIIKTKSGKTVYLNNNITNKNLYINLGFQLGIKYQDSFIRSEGNYATKNGLKLNDRIIYIDGKLVENFFDISVALKTSKDSAKLTLLRDGNVINVNYKLLKVGNRADGYKYIIGTNIKNTLITQKEEPLNLHSSIIKSFNDVYDFITIILNGIGKLITGNVQMSEVGGLITIADGAGKSAQIGLFSFMFYIAIFNVNIMVMNLLPIPPLDGWNTTKYVCEYITFRKINNKIETTIIALGVSVVSAFMLFAFFADILRFIL